MQKITFEDTTVTKQPYVTIDNVEYPVQDGTYSGGTDLDASTFNTMQNNIETAINDAISNSYGTSQTIGYSQNYINSQFTPVLYTLTEQPAHSSGVNYIYIYKINNLVVINVIMFLNSITANTWVNIGKLPNDIIPTTSNFYATGNVSNATDGSIVDFLKAEINNGYIRIKSQNGLGSLCSIQLNATYIIN